MSNIVKYIDEALRILDLLDKEYMEVFSSKDISGGKKLEIYQLLLDLREKLLAIRVLADRSCR
ncbi:MAG: hypothetical protein DRO40_12770 [Thermoprotei archaeon]|nr:MAG: hypothetical protein DRO40_12770 [Thermoprotei archaeon]